MKRYESYKPSGISWIGEIPSHWEVRKIRSLYALRTEKVSDKDFEPLSVSKQGVTPQLDDAVKTDNGDNRKLVHKGDFVVNSRSDRKGSCGVSDLDGSVSLINIVIYPITKLNPQYYHLLFRSNNYIEEFYRLGRGIVADLWTTKFDDMRNIFVPYPPIEEQKKIVEYLSTKTSLIDAQQRERERELRLLEELQQAEIANVVTRGLNPDVPMKDSGIPWIGKIPSHWEVRRNKYLFKEEDEKNLDLSFQLLTFSRKKGIIPFSEVNEKEPSASDLKNYKVIRQGQLLENRMQAWSGMFAKSEIDGCVSPDYSVFSPTSEDVCVDFFAHLFRTNQYIAHWANLSRGVGNGFNRLYTNQFHSVYALFPPIEEQRAIVEFIEQKNKAIDDMIANLRAEIDFLTEYKQRLIADAVTGQIKID